MTSKSKISNLIKGKSVPNLHSYSSPWTKQDKELMKAVESLDVKKVNTLLIKKSIATTKLGPNGKSVFHCACEVGNKQILDLILSKTQDVNDSTCQGVTSLHIAAAQGHSYTVDKLLKHHANVDKKDSNKMTALHHACAGQHLECVKALLMAKADPHAVDQGGRTPLHYAAHKGGPYGVTICQWLVEKGAQINWQDKDKNTSLMLAAREGHVDVCRFLLNHGALTDLQDKNGLTALEQGIQKGHVILTEIFERAPARSFENSSEQGSYTPSDSGSAVHDQIDGMSPIFRTHTEKARAAMSVCDDESFTRTDVHSIHSFHSMDDELLSHHQARNSSQPFLTNFSSHLQENYNELKADHDKLNEEYKNLSKENIYLREKLEALQLKITEIHQNESHEIKKLEEQLFAEKRKVKELEIKCEQVESQVKKETQSQFNHNDKEPSDDFALSKLKTQILALKEENDHLKANKTIENLIEYKGGQELNHFDNDASQFENEKKELLSQINKLQEERDKLESLKNVDAEGLLYQNSLMASELEILRHKVTELQERLPTETQRLDALISQNFEEVTFDEEGFVDGRDMTKEEFLQGQNQQLKAQCILLNDELSKLRTTFDAILKAGDNLQADYDQLAAEKDAIQDDLEVAVREKQTILAENEYLITDTNELHDSLNKLVHELEKMQEKYEAAQAECDDLKRSVTVASKVGEVSRLLEERDVLQERCSDLQDTKDRLQHDHTILLEEVQSLTDEVTQLSIEKEQLTSELEETCQQNETLQNDFNQLEIDFGELLKEKEILERNQLNTKKLNGATQTEFDVKIEIDKMEQLNVSEIQETMLKVNSAGLQMTWNSERDERLEKVEQVNSDYYVDREKIKILEGELCQLRKDFDELQKDKEMLEEFVNVLKTDHQLQMDKLMKEKKSLEEDFNEVKKMHSAEVQKSQLLEANVAKLTREQEAPEAQRTGDDSFQQLRDVDLTKLEQLEDEYAELLREKEALEAEYSQVYEELQMVKTESRKLLQEKSISEERLHKDQVRLQELEEKQKLLCNNASDPSTNVSEDYEKLKVDYQELLTEKEGLANVVHGLTKHNVAIEKKVKNLLSSLAEAKAAVTPVSHLEELNRNHEEIISLKKQIAKLTNECVEWEKKHADTVNTYRTHLLSAVQKFQQLEANVAKLTREQEPPVAQGKVVVSQYDNTTSQGHMDPDVKDALYHIIEIRSMEQFC